MKSAIYTGRLRHRRFKPTGNAFAYDVCMYYIDLNETEKFHKWPLATFRRRDYLGDPQTPLDQAVRDKVEKETGRRPTGPIRLLTQIAYMGYCFNPVSFYYCFNAQEQLEFIVAEITNTPWHERHSYVLPCTGSGKTELFSFNKEFHVSPFMGMDMVYRWMFSIPDEHLHVNMINLLPNQSTQFFDAILSLNKKEATSWNLWVSLMRYPLMTFKTITMIYWQALKLRIKRVPFYSHPNKGALS